MRYRRIVNRLLIFAAVLCVVSLAYLVYGRYRVSALEAACESALKSEQWAELEISATDWIQWQPDVALPWLYAAEAANRQGDDFRTAYYLYHLPDADPRSPAGLLELSHLQFGNLNQPFAAAATCERILRIPSPPSEANRQLAREAHRRLIFFYTMSRQRGRMIAEARRAIRVGCDVPETFLYLIAADWMSFTNGYDLNARWLQSKPGDEIFLVAQAFHLVRSSALSEESEKVESDGKSRSERVMDELLERFPHNKEVLAYHLDLACFRGNEDRVTKLLTQSPQDSAEDSRFWRFKGWVHQNRQEFAEAETAYLKTLELHSFDGQTLHDLAAICRRNKELQRVEEYQTLAVLGKELMRDCLQMPNTNSLDDDLLQKMILYVEKCGDTLVAQRLRERITKKPANPLLE
jgi:Flp pilus assembly protein TadD